MIELAKDGRKRFDPAQVLLGKKLEKKLPDHLMSNLGKPSMNKKGRAFNHDLQYDSTDKDGSSYVDTDSDPGSGTEDSQS